MLDRLLHRSVVLNLDGDSYRPREHHARAENLRKATTETDNHYSEPSSTGEHFHRSTLSTFDKPRQGSRSKSIVWLVKVCQVAILPPSSMSWIISESVLSSCWIFP